MNLKNVNAFALLGLSENESEILNLLQNHIYSTPLTLARLCTIPRPTIYITLEKLKARGIVHRKKQGKRYFWSLLDQEQLQNIFDTAKSTFLNERQFSDKIRLNQNTDIVMHYGKEKVLGLFEKMVNQQGGNRLMGIQGIYAGDAWQKLFKVEDLNRINSRIRDGGLITEIITSRDWFHRQVEIFGKSWAENFVGRAAQVHFIDDKYLNYKSQIFIFENQIFIVSMADELFIEIKNKEVSKLIISLIRFIEDKSNSVNINEIVAKLIK